MKTVAMIAWLSMAMSSNAEARNRLTIRTSIDQIVNIEKHAVRIEDGRAPVATRRASQIEIIGEFQDGITQTLMKNWLQDGTSQTPIDAVVEVVDTQQQVVRRIELRNCLPHRYVNGDPGASDFVSANDRFVFTGEVLAWYLPL